MTDNAVHTSVVAPYALQLGDDALVYAQRLGEWISRGPQIEEDMALGNVGLDLLGQARVLLTRAGELDGTGRTEDELAYLRDEREFRNVHLVEQPRSDFGFEMARMLWFSAYQCGLYAALVASSDETLSGVAVKAVKEVDYHRDHASHWVLQPGRRHRRVPRADAGGARPGRALRRRAVRGRRGQRCRRRGRCRCSPPVVAVAGRVQSTSSRSSPRPP